MQEDAGTVLRLPAHYLEGLSRPAEGWQLDALGNVVRNPFALWRVGTLARNLYLGRTMAWWDAADAKLAALTAAQVNEVLRRRIDPSTLSVYEAGDFAKAAKK